MLIYHHLDEIGRLEEGCVATIGNFDGVHLGHQAILHQARRLAEAEGVHLVGITFEPAPVRVLRPEEAPRRLTPLPIKIRLLEEHGLHRLLVLPATKELLEMTAEQFAREVLCARLGVRHVVEGQTFNFGRRRHATFKSLEELGRELGFGAHLVPSVRLQIDRSPVAVSSTLIRGQIMTGRLREARQCLGRPYVLGGTVVRGRGEGRKLDFPTANLAPYDQDQLSGEDGVYAGWARVGRDFESAWQSPRHYQAAISIGRCETFATNHWQIEAFLLDYDGPEFYESHLLLSLIERIRPQRKFAGPDALSQAIRGDCDEVRRILHNEGSR